ncbi:MAG: hypothetical protein PHR77_07430 [Kiritimatiellae bacterium]|nr:hypothetical protein [Kiritimatiellia bacterium]MDD5522635.1 hypothetical protein [Kiritimatiellia bacterium]
MKHVIRSLVCLLAGTTFAMAADAPNLMINGGFDDPENPAKYWTYDYTQSQNSNYADNHTFVSILPEFAGHKNVMKMDINWMKGCSGLAPGIRADSPLIPFEQGCRYGITLYIQSAFTNNSFKEGPYHIYVQGYQWKPGIKPYEHPSWFDMRVRYKGPWMGPRVGWAKTWTKISGDFPDKQLSAFAMQNLKAVKFISVHICGIMGAGQLYIDDLSVVKLSQGYTGGKITEDDRRKIKQK